MKTKSFAIFILSHGRANNIKTLKSLKDSNYTGDYYIVCDNEDKTLDEYKKLYGDKVLIFDKLKKSKEFDTMDNFDDRRTVVYARNASLDFAKQLGLKYYLELDDDYTEFCFRYKDDGHLRAVRMKNLDKVIDAMIQFLETSGALSIAMSQAGDFIGGAENGKLDKGIDRKCMNTFFCKTDRKLTFIGRVNEDVNTYTQLGNKGQLMFTIYKPSIIQLQTQSNSGGMTEQYLDAGTYIKSFYSVMGLPSGVKISILNTKNPRIHHRISWNNCCPKIISSKYRKV